MFEGIRFSFSMDQVEALYCLLDSLEDCPEDLFEIYDGLREEFAKCFALVKE